MFCGNCGNQISDGAKFCKKCGVKVHESSQPAQEVPKEAQTNETSRMQSDNAVQQSVNPVIVPSQTSKFSAKTNPTKKSKKKTGAIIAIVACCVVAIGLGVAAFFVFGQHNVNVPIKMDIDEGISTTRLPLYIKNNDEEELEFIDKDGEGLSLSDGDYELRFAGSPLSYDGTFFDYPTDTFSVNVSGNNTTWNTNKDIYFKKADMEKVTDKQIQDAIGLAKKDSASEEIADQYGEATKKKRDEAKAEAEKKKAEEEARKQAEEAQRQAEEAQKAKEQKKALAATQLVTGKYVYSKDPTKVMELNLEQKIFTITQNGTKVEGGKILDYDEYVKYSSTQPEKEYYTKAVGGTLDVHGMDFYLSHRTNGLSFAHIHDAGWQDFDGEWTFVE